MKLIIDIPEEDYNYAKQQVADGITNPLKIYISNATPIPDNATNGDVITEILKSSYYMRSTRCIGLAQEDIIYIEVGSNWWNAPYQKGGKG